MAEAGSEQPKRLLSRRRRANTVAGERRSRVIEVSVTPAEEAELRERAAAAEVTVPRLLFESATSGRPETDAERRAAIAAVFQLQRLLANATNNLNQMARYANTEGHLHAESAAAVAEYRALVPQVQAALSAVSGR